MKNIHILPTLQPSRLWFHKLNRNLGFSDLPMEYNGSGTWVEGRNIYITNDEEIKEGDCHLSFLRDKFEVINYLPNGGYRAECLGKEVCKIILTTDQDLIADGVQAIDDEFLEWFVKNPSCEFVETGSLGIKNRKTGKNVHYKYLITIPQEEPKQELPIINGSYGCTIETKKKETLVERMTPLQLKYNLDKMKQETLEEVAEIFVNNRFSKQISGDKTYPDIYASKEAIVESHILFSKWQQERMYSEEQLFKILLDFVEFPHDHNEGRGSIINRFLKELKKK